jgi:hypothetical protein
VMDCCERGNELIHVMPKAWNMKNIKMVLNLQVP